MTGKDRSKHCSVLITGGAGFVGTNLAARLLASGEPVRILDSLIRPGSEENIAWLRQRYREPLDFMQADIRNPSAMNAAPAAPLGARG